MQSIGVNKAGNGASSCYRPASQAASPSTSAMPPPASTTATPPCYSPLSTTQPENVQRVSSPVTILSCPTFSGQGICGYFTLLPARSGTHPGLLAESGTRAWSGDESYYIGVRSIAQCHPWLLCESCRRSGRPARSSASRSPIPAGHYHSISRSVRQTALSRAYQAHRRIHATYSCCRGQNGIPHPPAGPDSAQPS
jgi:hypothetical protein